MQKNHFLLLKTFKNTSSAQLWLLIEIYISSSLLHAAFVNIYF